MGKIGMVVLWRERRPGLGGKGACPVAGDVGVLRVGGGWPALETGWGRRYGAGSWPPEEGEGRRDASQSSPAISQGRGGVPQGDDSRGAAGGGPRDVPALAQAQGDGEAPVGSQAKDEPTPRGIGAGPGGGQEDRGEPPRARGGGGPGGARRAAECGEE